MSPVVLYHLMQTRFLNLNEIQYIQSSNCVPIAGNSVLQNNTTLPLNHRPSKGKTGALHTTTRRLRFTG